MSLYHNFDPVARPGFIRYVDATSARRQLHISLGLAAVLALAIGGSALAIRPGSGFDTRTQRANIADLAAANHHALQAGMRYTLSNGG